MPRSPGFRRGTRSGTASSLCSRRAQLSSDSHPRPLGHHEVALSLVAVERLFEGRFGLVGLPPSARISPRVSQASGWKIASSRPRAGRSPPGRTFSLCELSTTGVHPRLRLPPEHLGGHVVAGAELGAAVGPLLGLVEATELGECLRKLTGKRREVGLARLLPPTARSRGDLPARRPRGCRRAFRSNKPAACSPRPRSRGRALFRAPGRRRRGSRASSKRPSVATAPAR